MTLTIKIICALLRSKFSDVNPSYDGRNEDQDLHQIITTQIIF
jgi:hypothetical protein